MFKKLLGGQGSIFVILIIAAVIGFSFLASDGILPKIRPDDKFEKVVSQVFLPSSDKTNTLQLKNLEFDPNSVTIIPSPTLSSQNLPSTNPSPENTPLPTLIASAPSSTVSPANPSTTPAITRGATTTPPASTPLPIATPTPGLAPLNSFQKNLLALARSQIGEHYGMGACENWASSSTKPSDPPKQSNACSKWDCSNFVAWLYHWTTNGKFNMKSQTCADFGDCIDRSGNYKSENPNLYTKFYKKDLSKIQFGDLVYFGTVKNGTYYPSHVGLYIGPYGDCGAKDCIIDASASGGGVSERSLAKVPKGIIGFLRPKI